MSFYVKNIRILTVLFFYIFNHSVLALEREGNFLLFIRQKKRDLEEAISQRTREIGLETYGTSRIWSVFFNYNLRNDQTLKNHQKQLQRITTLFDFLNDHSKWRRNSGKSMGIFEKHVKENSEMIKDFRFLLPSVDCSDLNYVDSLIDVANSCLKFYSYEFPLCIEDFFSENFFAYCESTKEEFKWLTEINL